MISEFVGNEYLIKEMHPVRPLMNFCWNEKVIANYNQFGFGEVKALTENGFRLISRGERLVYVKENNEFYAANRNYTNLPFDKFETHVGLNYQTIVSSYRGLEVSLTLFVPRTGYAEISHVHVKNLTKKKRNFSLYFYSKPFINLTWHTAFSRAYFDERDKCLVFSHIGYDMAEKYQVLVEKSSVPFSGYSTSDIQFKGIYNELSSPIGLKSPRLSGIPMTFDGDASSAMQFEIELENEGEKDINIVTAIGQNKEDALETVDRYLTNEAYFLEKEETKKEIDELNHRVVLSSKDEYLNKLINIWLKRQISLGKSYGRVYGKGFRDVLQDISSFLIFDSETAKKKILLVLAHQFKSGNGLRQFDPVFDYPYQDGPVWIPDTVLAYLKETNDFSLLDEKIPYYDSSSQESVFLHMKKGLDYLFNRLGEHQLVKWGGGDWNDSLNACGLKGRGESVWLSIALVKATNSFIEICKKIGFDSQPYERKKASLEESIVKHGLENDQYIYGYNDLGDKVGSKDNKEGKLYLNPQTWAVLADVGNKEIQEKVMAKVEKELSSIYGFVQLKPSYTKGDDSLGRATYFAPGCYENGSCYNHGTAFKIAANLLLNQPELAYLTLQKVYPLNHPESGMEEYAIGNMYFGEDAISRKGFSPMPWISGTCGWLFKDVVELMCGIKPDYDGLIISPRLPKELESVDIERVYQGTRFFISIRHTGQTKMLIDGKESETNKVIAKKKEIHVLYEY